MCTRARTGALEFRVVGWSTLERRFRAPFASGKRVPGRRRAPWPGCRCLPSNCLSFKDGGVIYILRSALYTLHSTLYTLRLSYILRFTIYALRFTLYFTLEYHYNLDADTEADPLPTTTTTTTATQQESTWQWATSSRYYRPRQPRTGIADSGVRSPVSWLSSISISTSSLTV